MARCQTESTTAEECLGQVYSTSWRPSPNTSCSASTIPLRPASELCLREEAYRVLGVDLTTIPGLSVLNVQTIVAEVGPDLSWFRGAAAFSSWLGLCPDNSISRGKVLKTATRKVKNRLPAALRMAAQSPQASRHWASFIGACAQGLEHQTQLLPPPTNRPHDYHLITTRPNMTKAYSRPSKPAIVSAPRTS